MPQNTTAGEDNALSALIALAGQADEIVGAVDRLDDEIMKRDATIDDLNATIDELNTKIAALETALAEERNTVLTLQSKLDDLSA